MQNDQSLTKLFINGYFYVSPSRLETRLLVKDGRVIKAYHNDEEQIEPNDVVDLDGGFVFPGFIDSHVHLVELGCCDGAIPLDRCIGAQSIIDTVDAAITDKTGTSLIIGAGFSLDNYDDDWTVDDRTALSKATGNHPFMAFDNLGHNMLVNEKALTICEITDVYPPNPMGGVIVRVNGVPTGILRESAMALAGTKLFGRIDDETIKKGALPLLNLWAQTGYTSIVDLMGSPAGQVLRPELCIDLEQKKLLPLRVNYMYTFFKLDEIDGAKQYLEPKWNTDMVRFGGLKLFVDGAYAGGQAWTSWDHQMPPSSRGLSYVCSEEVPNPQKAEYNEQYDIDLIVAKVNELGFNIHYHVQGDDALKAVLLAIEKEWESPRGLTSTHTLIHLAFPTEEQMEQIKKFEGKVIATVQPAFWESEEGMSRYYGTNANKSYPIKSLMDKGISTGISTDYWVSKKDQCPPTAIMKIALSGGGAPADDHPPLRINDLIKGFTVGSAATTCWRDKIGTLEEGCLADMTVYDGDLYKLDKGEFSEFYPKVLSTWIAGEPKYSSADPDWASKK